MLNKIIVATLPLVPKPIVHIFAKKYIAGDLLKDAVQFSKDFEKSGGMTTIDFLGEFVEDKERALLEREVSSKILDAISENNLKTYLSIKPTSLGLGIDMDFAYENISYLVDKARKLNLFVRIDMENSPYTTKTLDTYKKLRDAGYDNVGIVIQTYMRRSMDDIIALSDYKPNVRLCKGIYVEEEAIAFKDPDEVRDSYKKILNRLLDNGSYVGFATQDEELIQYSEQEVIKRKLENNQYEFQMLLGVREARRASLIKKGYPMRVYTPFGEDWYGYSSRRLKENPAMVGHIVKSIFGLNR